MFAISGVVQRTDPSGTGTLFWSLILQGGGCSAQKVA